MTWNYLFAKLQVLLKGCQHSFTDVYFPSWNLHKWKNTLIVLRKTMSQENGTTSLNRMWIMSQKKPGPSGSKILTMLTCPLLLLLACILWSRWHTAMSSTTLQVCDTYVYVFVVVHGTVTSKWCLWKPGWVVLELSHLLIQSIAISHYMYYYVILLHYIYNSALLTGNSDSL